MKASTNPLSIVTFLLAMCSESPALAAGLTDAQGLWLTVDHDAIVKFAPCSNQPASLCARVVWDKDAGTSANACGIEIARLDRFDGSAWRDGWVYDPRDKKTYQAIVRAKGRDLAITAYAGVSAPERPEAFKRVNSLPSSPKCGD